MALVKFIPSVCKGEAPTFEGFVSVRSPNFDEKYGFLEDLDVKTNEDGQVEIVGNKAGLSMIRKAVKASVKFYQHVELKHLASGAVYSSFDDLSCDDKAHGILIEVATVLMAGLPMGNG